MPGRLHRKVIRIPCLLFCGVLLLTLFPPWFSVSPALAFLEVGDSPGPGTASVKAPAWLDPEIELASAWRYFSEDVTESTYGSMPIVQARFSVRISRTIPSLRLFLGAGYGWADGDPYYDRPSFTGGGRAELRVVPVQAGLRLALLSSPRWRLIGGFQVEAVWSRETLPTPYEYDQAATARTSGWTNGIGVTLGPQWRSADERSALGLDVGLVGNSGPNRGTATGEINLSGMAWRIYYSIGI